MTISFAGLLFPKILVVEQYGFALFVGVLIDTFVMRPIIVPAILSVGPREKTWNWLPYRMPAPELSEADELSALAAGCDEPAQFRAQGPPADAQAAAATAALQLPQGVGAEAGKAVAAIVTVTPPAPAAAVAAAPV